MVDGDGEGSEAVVKEIRHWWMAVVDCRKCRERMRREEMRRPNV